MFLFCIQNKIDFTKNSINQSLFSSAITRNIKVVKCFVEHCHADVETKDICGNIPLNSASRVGNIEVVKYLVENGCKVTKRDIRYGYDIIKQFLKEHMN